MTIKINEQAKKLLKEKESQKSCDNIVISTILLRWEIDRAVVVSMADKFNEELYSKYVVDGIDIYIDYRLNINEKVEIGVEKFFFMRQFESNRNYCIVNKIN